jgi:hypothetical protein
MDDTIPFFSRLAAIYNFRNVPLFSMQRFGLWYLERFERGGIGSFGGPYPPER